MNVSAKYCNEEILDQSDLKCRFSNLKYEQLMAEKYFVETCFSRIDESYSARQKLTDIYFKIKVQ